MLGVFMSYRFGIKWGLFLFVCTTFSLQAGTTVYQEPNVFVEEAFEGVPEKSVVWITKDIQAGIRQILDHDYPGLRIRYWKEGKRTAWILEEIGKVKPITAGFVVDQQTLIQMQVLIYRESHGAEVQYPFFSDQFSQLELNEDNQLNKSIDGISGATLSVNALTRLARLALYLDREVSL